VLEASLVITSFAEGFPETILFISLVAPNALSIARYGLRTSTALAVTIPLVWSLLALGFAIPLALRLPFNSRIAYVIAIAFTIAVMLRIRKRTTPIKRTQSLTILLSSAVWPILSTQFVQEFHLVRVTPDSLMYLAHAKLLETGNIAVLNSREFQKRGLGISTVHGLADLTGSDLFAALQTAVAPAAIILTFGATLYWAKTNNARRQDALFGALAGALLLLSVDRFLYAALLINNHGFFGCGVLTLYFGLAVDRPRRLPKLEAGALAVLLFGLNASRPEGPLITGFVAIFVLLTIGTGVVQARTFWVYLSAISQGLHIILFLVYMRSPARNGLVKSPVGDPYLVALLLVPAFLSLTCFLVTQRNQWLERVQSRLLVIMLLSLYGFFIIGVTWVSSSLTLVVISTTIGNILQNLLYSGGWRLEIFIFAMAFGLTGGSSREPTKALRRLLLGLLFIVPGLAVLRDGVARVGPGDSFNRMMIHFVPLCCVLVGLCVAEISSIVRKSNRQNVRGVL